MIRIPATEKYVDDWLHNLPVIWLAGVVFGVIYPKRARAADRRSGLVTPIRACGLAGSQVARGMKKISYKGYRFPLEIIQQAIWLYVRFTLSFRELVDVCVRRQLAASLRQRQLDPRP